MPRHLEVGDTCQPDRAEPEHDRRVLPGDPALVHGVDADREWLGQRRERRRHTAGDGDRQQLVQHQQLGVAARVAARVSDGVDAIDVEHGRHADDHLPGREIAHVRSDLDDLTAELVAHHGVGTRLERDRSQRIGRQFGFEFLDQAAQLGAVFQHVQVAPTDAARQHPGQHLPRPWDRLGDVVDPQFPFPHHRGAHARTVGRPFTH